MKSLIVVLGILVTRNLFAMQKITCPHDQVEFRFDQLNLDNVKKTVFTDKKANLEGKFSHVIDKVDRIYFEIKNIRGTFVRVIFPKSLINQNSDGFRMFYYRINTDEYVEDILDCTSELSI
jgi:hypothetical protein